MNVNIKNMLDKTDYEKISDLFIGGYTNSIEIVKELDFFFISTDSLRVFPRKPGYTIESGIHFNEPIDYTTILYQLPNIVDLIKHLNLRPNDVDYMLERNACDNDQLGNDIVSSVDLLKNFINSTLSVYGEFKKVQLRTINKYELDKIARSYFGDDEKGIMNQKIVEFGTLYANNYKEAKELAKGYVPLYKGYDRHSLFSRKIEFWILPKQFVRKLLRCEESTMIDGGDLSEKERAVLENLVHKQKLKKHKNFYYNLDPKTRRFFYNFLRGNRH